MVAALIAQASPSPAPTPQCFRDAQGAVLNDGPFADTSKGAAPYYAVAEIRINADDSVQSVRIYKSSGSADYDRDTLVIAQQLVALPEIAHCKHVESHFFYLHYPRGYVKPQFTPHP